MDTIRLISNEYGDTPLVESYRTLRSNLQYRCNAENRKLLCVTSATTGEGVSEVIYAIQCNILCLMLKIKG